MHLNLPKGAASVLKRLNDAGYEAYAVGGCVRDMLRGVVPHDYDICTSARPQETERCFCTERVVETGLAHGTVTVLMQGEAYEITTFRTDGQYLDGRHPQNVSFTNDLTEDLRRRDFTINAMAYHPVQGLRDPFGGQADLACRVIRCVGEPEARFCEDALRILRALRFAAELGYAIEADTARAMRNLAGRLALISRERIAAELLRALDGANAVPVLRAFEGVVLSALPDYPPNALPAALSALEKLPCGDHVLRMAALLAPCGQAAQAVLASLKPSRAYTSQVLALAELADEQVQKEEMPLWLSKLGQEQLRRLLIMQHREQLLSLLPALAAQPLPWELRQLAINGRDLQQAGLASGPQIGRMLAQLHRQALLGEIPNERAALMQAARQMKI